jgi:hypothetical protein
MNSIGKTTKDAMDSNRDDQMSRQVTWRVAVSNCDKLRLRNIKIPASASGYVVGLLLGKEDERILGLEESAVEAGVAEEPSASRVTSLGKRLAIVPNVRSPHTLAFGSGYERAKSRV